MTSKAFWIELSSGHGHRADRTYLVIAASISEAVDKALSYTRDNAAGEWRCTKSSESVTQVLV